MSIIFSLILLCFFKQIHIYYNCYCVAYVFLCSAVSKNGVLYFKEKFCCDNFEKHEDGKCHGKHI